MCHRNQTFCFQERKFFHFKRNKTKLDFPRVFFLECTVCKGTNESNFQFQVRLLAEHHRCLLDASKTIAEFLKTTPAPANQVSSIADTVDNDQLSDSSSESEASPSTSNSQVRSMRRITSEQLASALNFAGTNSRNSLASISQRNLSQQQSVDGSPAATTSTSTTPTRITNSMFMNALSEVLLSTRQQAGRLSASNSASEIGQPAENQEESIADTTAATANPSDVASNSMPMFLAELQQMREMGLADTEINLQALMITNGDGKSD
jgi:hypothetical protein